MIMYIVGYRNPPRLSYSLNAGRNIDSIAKKIFGILNDIVNMYTYPKL